MRPGHVVRGLGHLREDLVHSHLARSKIKRVWFHLGVSDSTTQKTGECE